MKPFQNHFCTILAILMVAVLLCSCGDSSSTTEDSSTVESESAAASEDSLATSDEESEEESEIEEPEESEDAEEDTESEPIALSDEDEELLEAFGDDLNVISSEDFITTVSGINEDDIGMVYQLTGYYLTALSDEGEADYLCSAASDPEASIQLRYLTAELNEGEQYTITAIVAQEEHDDHAHIVFDVVTVESYLG